MLALLGGNSPIMLQSRELGESLLHLWVYHLAGGEGHADALFSYQAVSIGSGVVLTAAVIQYSLRIYRDRLKSALFAAGILSSGYMLLYFGYVENYSVLTVFTLIFLLQGICVIERQLPRWTVLLPLVGALFMHVAAIVLIPPFLALLIVTEPRTQGILRKYRVLVSGFALIIIVGLGLFGYHVWRANYALRLLLIPFWRDQFAIDGYTLISVAHLLDLINLTFTMLPGLFVAGVGVFLKRNDLPGRSSLGIFLLTALTSAVGAAFLLDPKLGMPRDWDLYCWYGAALSIAAFTLLLWGESMRRLTITTASLMILCNVTVLGARVIVLNEPDLAVEQFSQYADLDPARFRGYGPMLQDFYRSRGDTAAADETSREWRKRYPETVWLGDARAQMQAGHPDSVIAICRRILERAPNFWNAYMNWGRALEQQGRLDSALTMLAIAHGMSPYDPVLLTDIGYVKFRMGRFDEAEAAWQEAVTNGPHLPQAASLLIKMYRRQDETDKVNDLLGRLVTDPQSGTSVRLMAAEEYAAMRQWADAAKALRVTPFTGVDTLRVKHLLSRYPELREAYGR